jgi:hypothetical protein
MTMTMLVHAVLETDHFTFEAYAPTKAKAEALLKAGTLKHCLQYGADHPEFWSYYSDNINYGTVRSGLFTRDGEEVKL